MPVTRPFQRRRRAALAAIASLSLLAAACGGDDGDEPESSSGATTATSAATGGQQAESQGPVTFETAAGLTPIDFAKVRGKKVTIVAGTMTVPIVAQWADEIRQAMEGTGVTLSVFDGKFDPNEWVRGIEQATASKDAAIFLLAVPPAAVAPQISAAKAAGVPVIASLNGYGGLSTEEFPDLAADVGFDYRIPGRLMGEWFVADSEGKGKAIIFSSDENPSSPFVWQPMVEVIEQTCPDCEFEIEDAPVPSWSDGGLQQRAKALYQANPDTTHMLAVYDGMTLAIEPGLIEAGATDVRVAGFNGTPAVMENVKKGTAVKMDVGNPNMWFSASAADTVLRVLSGTAPVIDHGVPFRVFTEDNLEGVDTSKEDPMEWYGIDPRAEYRKIWGL